MGDVYKIWSKTLKKESVQRCKNGCDDGIKMDLNYLTEELLRWVFECVSEHLMSINKKFLSRLHNYKLLRRFLHIMEVIVMFPWK